MCVCLQTRCMLFRHLTGFLHKHGRISKGTLKRSSSTNLLGINSGVSTLVLCTDNVLSTNSCVYYSFQSRGQLGGHTRIYSHVVVTLDPNKFAEKKQQRLHIGGLQAFDPYIMLRNQSSPVTPFLAPRLVYDMARMSGKREILAYPPDTKAFLYYYTSREIPRIAGELRLRVASSDDPASFESGSDLLKTNGQIWSRPLYVVSKCYAPLYEILREDQLVPEDLHSTLSTLPPVSPRYRRRHILYTLNDEFIVDFSGARSLCIITEQGVEKLLLFGPFAEERFGRPLTAPYTGAYTKNLPSQKNS